MTIHSLDILLSQFGASPLSCSNCSFLTWEIQISQEAGKVVWYSHLFKNFPQFVVIHTVKGFSVGQWSRSFSGILLLFLWPNSSWQFDLWFLYLNPAWTSGSSRFTYYRSLAWRILSIASLVCEMSTLIFPFWPNWEAESVAHDQNILNDMIKEVRLNGLRTLKRVICG